MSENLKFTLYKYNCNQTVMENDMLVKVDCKPDYYNWSNTTDTFYVPSRPEETTLECITNKTDHFVSLIMHASFRVD